MLNIKESETKKEIHQTYSLFDSLGEMGHEQVVFCHDTHTGLKAIIAVHNSVLGAALGGVRMWNYASEQEALTDVLRLSRGMTFKNAIAGLNLGGGKAVIIGNPRKDKTEAMLRMYGKFVKNLNGKYLTAEDVGMTEKDMEYINMETKYVTGLPTYVGGSGAPAPMTAYGTYMGMKAAAKKVYGSESLTGKKIAIQGVGHVGEVLVDLLTKEGSKIFITDIYEDRIKDVASKYTVEVVDKDAIYDLDVDIYAPCALGATINDETLYRLKCNIIAGCANNQLKDEQIHGDECLKRGIVYVPDFLINAGGVINIATEVNGAYNKAWATAQTETIYEKTLTVLNTSLSQGRNAQKVAMEIALQRINDIAKIKAIY
jgi:leucine dehydrogenase